MILSEAQTMIGGQVRACSQASILPRSRAFEEAGAYPAGLFEELAGLGLALANLEVRRIGIAAQCIGMAQAALDIAVAYAKECKSFGIHIIDHQAVGFRLADLAARLEAARQLALHAASL